MNKNLNLVEVLKDCPKGTKLYSIIHGEVAFEGIEDDFIEVSFYDKDDDVVMSSSFLSDGTYCPTGECVLFPAKNQRDWSKFKVEPEMVDGEFYYCLSNLTGYSFIFIYKKHMSYKTKHYASFNITSSILFKDDDIVTNNGNIAELRKATDEEKQLLLNAIKRDGYNWDADKKELVKIEPKFDINTLQPFDKVLGRDNNAFDWRCDFFSHIGVNRYKFICAGVGNSYVQCIPYNADTMHLVGTKEMPPEKYITWEE